MVSVQNTLQGFPVACKMVPGVTKEHLAHKVQVAAPLDLQFCISSSRAVILHLSSVALASAVVSLKFPSQLPEPSSHLPITVHLGFYVSCFIDTLPYACCYSFTTFYPFSLSFQPFSFLFFPSLPFFIYFLPTSMETFSPTSFTSVH